MNKDEALKIAIENLEICLSLMITKDYSDDFYQSVEDSIKTCKQTLKQTTQPLEIEIINNLYDMAHERDGDVFDFDHTKFARSIEQEHGINYD